MKPTYRIDVRLSPESTPKAYGFWSEFEESNEDCKSHSELLIRLIELYKSASLLSTNFDLLSNLTAEKLAQKFRVIEPRTGTTEKNTRVLLETMNGLLFHLGINGFITTDQLHTQALQAAETKVAKDVDNINKRNLEAKREREAGSS
ncbi:hypothetical protein [Enterococcus sp. LJL90]